MALGLRVFSERTSNGEPILDESNGEVIMHTQPSVSIVLGNRSPESPGTLYISSKQVIWLSDVDRSKGYAVDFVSISLHAVSRDPEAYPSPCIYSQIETGDNEEEDDDEDEEQHQAVDWSSGISMVKEMRLVPSDSSQLETLFDVFCECAELNPEPMQDEDDGEEHNWIFSADQLNAETLGEDASNWSPSGDNVNLIGYSNGNHDLAHNVLQRFEDAEEMEHECDKNNSRQ